MHGSQCFVVLHNTIHPIILVSQTFYVEFMCVSVNDHPKMSIVDDGRELQVRDVCKECQGGLSDLMVVQCNASNNHGYAFSSAYINVLS